MLHPIICYLTASYYILQTQHLLIRDTASAIIFEVGGDMKNLVNLRETQRTSKLNIISKKNNVNDIVLVYDEMVPRHFWKFATVTRYYLVEILK